MRQFTTSVSALLLSLTMWSCASIRPCSGPSAGEVIKSLKLQPMSDEACPGYYLPTYESRLRAKLSKDRPAASLIYYLMTEDVPIDPFHILLSDEIILYHAGAPMIQMLLYPDGTWKEVVLGPHVEKGEVMQQVIPAGTWMGFVKKDDPYYDWGLYGVMVVPGWNIEDIRMVEGETGLEKLRKRYPTAVKRGKELGLF